MENDKSTYSLLTEFQNKSRLDFCRKYSDLDWNRVVFIGLKKINGIEVLGAISRLDGCPFRAVGYQLKTHQHVSFLDDEIYPLWKKNKNLIFVQVRKH